MAKRFRMWINALIILLFLTAFFHSLSFFIHSEPANDTERQLNALLENYKFDLGAGFHRSYNQVMVSLSACFTLLCLFGAFINLYFLRKRLTPDLWKGLLPIQAFIYGILFVVMVLFAFLPPIVCSGLLLCTCLGARFSLN